MKKDVTQSYFGFPNTLIGGHIWILLRPMETLLST